MKTPLNRYQFYSLIVATIAIGAIMINWYSRFLNVPLMGWGWYLYRVGMYASAVWVAMILVGYFRFRSAANRMLIGAPLALFWPSLAIWSHFYEQWRINN
jgi:hypothetical protein